MKMRALARLALCFLFLGALTRAQATPNPSATSTGQAIGNGVKGFLNAVFPTGTNILNLLQNWLTEKLTTNQQKQINTAADAQRKNAGGSTGAAPVKPPNISDISTLQNAADTLKLVGIVFDHTDRIASSMSAMLSILDTTPGALPFSRLNQQWNDAKADLSALRDDGTLQDARKAITDTDVIGGLSALDRVTRSDSGPVKTITDNMKPGGDRRILREQLAKVLEAVVKFNELGVVILGSTGTEISRAIADFKSSGGRSDLDQQTEHAVNDARDTLTKLSH